MIEETICKIIELFIFSSNKYWIILKIMVKIYHYKAFQIIIFILVQIKFICVWICSITRYKV